MPAIADNTVTAGAEVSNEAAAAPSSSFVDGPRIGSSKNVADWRGEVARSSASAKPRISQSPVPVHRAELNQRPSCWLFWCGSHVVLMLGVAY
jgi:hypothetical protein